VIPEDGADQLVAAASRSGAATATHKNFWRLERSMAEPAMLSPNTRFSRRFFSQ
jgi:hypothetical protein